MTNWEQVTHSPRQTWDVGRKLGQLLRAGDVVALVGPLGAGKTQLVKGLAAGVGVPDDEQVASPTFVLVREYVGNLRLYHIDAYRLSGPEELAALGFDELCERPDAVVAVEWADRVRAAIPPAACWVEMQHVSRMRRSIRVCWPAARWSEVTRCLLPDAEPDVPGPEAVDRQGD